MSPRIGNEKSRSGGFTLIELMMAIAVLSVLVAVGYPSYIQYAAKARRAEARTVLSQTQTMLERCRSKTHAYNGSACTGTYPNSSENNYYEILRTVTGTTYSVTAKAKGLQLKDKTCAELSVNNLGERRAVDAFAADSSRECWGL